jgi:hypothetical protein
MNVYMYKAALLCSPCMIKRLLAEGKAAPGALGMEPKEVLRQIVESSGFNFDNEGEWDTDDLPKGPYPDSGGEADTPQHCDECHLFLQNDLTKEGYAYVGDAIASFILNGGNQTVIRQWFDFYGMHVSPP